MRRNLLHWCNLVLISKILMFYEFGLVRTYQYLADLLQKKIMIKNSGLKFSKYMQNLSRSKRFGKFVLIVGDNCPFKKDIYRGIPMVHLAPLVSPWFPPGFPGSPRPWGSRRVARTASPFRLKGNTSKLHIIAIHSHNFVYRSCS